MILNRFDVEILADGAIRLTSPGSFSKEAHMSADELLAKAKELAGGDTVKKKLEKPLAEGKSSQQQHH